MRILVMQKGTGLYLGKRRTWVKHKHQALHFKTSTKALEYCLAEELSGIDFLLNFEDSNWDIRVPDVLGEKPLPPAARKYFPLNCSGMGKTEPC